MANGPKAGPNERIDREIGRFVDQIAASYAEHSPAGGNDLAERRRIAELVRTPWRKGGPAMTETSDVLMDGIRLRIHRPTGAMSPSPVLFYIHGGGWTLFSVDTHDRLMREYAARAGIVVVGIDYSLSPEAKFPVAIEQCAAALDWIANQAEARGFDAARILIGGDSAGANLALSTCLWRRARGAVVPVGMLLNYGAFAPDRTPSYALYGQGDYSLDADEMDAFWENYVAAPADYSNPLAVPLLADLTGLPPAFLAIAECDILVDCNNALAARLSQAGVPTRAITYAGATHSFLEAVSISSLADRALDDQARWIREILG